jgi:hypothetical protein
MRRGAGVPPAVERAFCPCRFTAKMAVPQLADRTCPERSEGMSTPQRARTPSIGDSHLSNAGGQKPELRATSRIWELIACAPLTKAHVAPLRPKTLVSGPATVIRLQLRLDGDYCSHWNPR